VPDVLLEEVEDRRDPALAEPHARAHALRLELLRPRVGRLLEERDARLAPQLTPEEERRVRGERHLHAGDRLRGVPVVVELRELRLEVRVADRLEHGRVDECRVARLVGEVELDLQAEGPPVVLEARLGQHAREDVEARPDLLPVALAVFAAEGVRGELLPHARSVPAGRAREAGGPRHRGCGLRGATAGAARYAPASEGTSGCS